MAKERRMGQSARSWRCLQTMLKEGWPGSRTGAGLLRCVFVAHSRRGKEQNFHFHLQPFLALLCGLRAWGGFTCTEYQKRQARLKPSLKKGRLGWTPLGRQWQCHRFYCWSRVCLTKGQWPQFGPWFRPLLSAIISCIAASESGAMWFS